MKISVLVNNFNYGSYIKYCIDSVLNQTRHANEIIVYDDGSTDNSLEILSRYGSAVKVIANPNHGNKPSFNQANAINLAFRASEGDIICLLDSDDAFLPDKLGEVEEAFSAHAGIVMVQHPFLEIDASSVRTGVVRPKLKDVDAVRYVRRTHNIFGLFAQTSALSFSRAYLDTVLPIRPDDFEMVWPDVRLTRQTLFHGKFITIRRPLAEYRIHGSNDSAKLKDRTYFWNQVRQQYGFYNQVAAQHGAPGADLDKSINQDFPSNLDRILCFVRSGEPTRDKLRLILMELEYLRRRIFRRTRQLILGERKGS
ncbi:MAG: glycosyltransferase family 2 protein [Novosphingobium sp.]